ncbi:MAG: carboxy terminal-processing peptidase [Gammaproteobacteria bacterium]|nr:carboxy terminal-processing peptidase [Gammaproteobacteria bacterium]
MTIAAASRKFLHTALASAVVTLSLSASLPSLAGTPADSNSAAGLPELQPQPQQGIIEQLIARYYAANYHFNAPSLDDGLSEAFYNRFLEVLDPSRVYFTAEDVSDFDKYRLELDDALKDGRTEPAYEIYGAFRNKVLARIEKIDALLQTRPDFTVEESFTFDRSNVEWAATEKELDDYWRKRIKNEAIGLLMSNKSWEEAADTLSTRYDNFRRRVMQVNSEDVFDLFINAYATMLDPHTTYFSPRDSEEFRIRMSLSYEGIGASLQADGEYVKIVRLLPGGSAEKSGKLDPDDRITAVGQDDGELVDVVGWRLDDVVDLIRGPKDSVVRLQVLPAGRAPGGDETVIQLTRSEIQLEEQAAQAETITIPRSGGEASIGVIEIPTFYQDTRARDMGLDDYRSTTRDVRKLIEQLSEDGVDGLIIDLRNNGGGLLNEATDLTGLFIDRGPVVQIKNTLGSLEIQEDLDAGVAWDGPLVVLVNRFSASSSEIFAGAIQDYGRGLVVGSTTYGKGTVQTLFPLNRHQMEINTQADLGQLKMTLGKFYRVTGSSTQHRGVVPDITLPSPIDPEDFGESAQPTALPWDEIPAADGIQEVRVPALDLLPEVRQRIAERQSEDAVFQAYVSDIEAQRALRAQQTVSLNLKERRLERDQREAAALERLNARRAARGLDAVDSLEDAAEEDREYDVIRHEAARIMADYLAELMPPHRTESLASARP